MITVEHGSVANRHNSLDKLCISISNDSCYSGTPLLKFLVDKGDAKLIFQKSDEEFTEIPLNKEDGGFWVKDPIDLNIIIYFGFKPWYTQFNLIDHTKFSSSKMLYIAYKGWIGDEWFDGPFAHFLSEKRVASYVPYFHDSRIVVPASIKNSDLVKAINLDLLEDIGRRDALVFAVRERVGELDGLTTVLLENFGLYEAILISLLRMAFPDQKLQVCSLPSGGERAFWRRLCQNLAIEIHEGKKDFGTETIDLPRLCSSLVPKALYSQIASQINCQSDLIPPKLLERV